MPSPLLPIIIFIFPPFTYPPRPRGFIFQDLSFRPGLRRGKKETDSEPHTLLFFFTKALLEGEVMIYILLVLLRLGQLKLLYPPPLPFPPSRGGDRTVIETDVK